MMKSLIRSVSLAALALFAALPTHAETVKLESAGIQFDLPTGWTSAAEGGNVIRVQNANGSFKVVLTVAAMDSIEDVVARVSDEVDKYLKDVKVDGLGTEGEFNGMQTWSVSGTGTREGETWAWDITVFNAKKLVVVLSWATPEVLKNPSADVIAFQKSVKKI